MTVQAGWPRQAVAFKARDFWAHNHGFFAGEPSLERFDGLDDDPETHALVAAAVAAEQVTELLDEGVTEFHFYTLNRSNLVLALARLLGRRP